SRRAQGIHFRVRLARSLMPAFTNNLAILHHHATDTRIGRCGVPAALRKRDRARHESMVSGGKHASCPKGRRKKGEGRRRAVQWLAFFSLLPSHFSLFSSGSSGIWCLRRASSSGLFSSRSISSRKALTSWKLR